MRRSFPLLLAAALVLPALPLGSSRASEAREFHIDPNGTIAESATRTPAFQSLEDALSQIRLQSGDRLLLHSGSYGDLRIQGQHLDGPVFLQPAPGAEVVADTLRISDSSGWHLTGLLIEPQRPLEVPRDGPDVGPPGFPTTLVVIEPDAQDIVLEGFSIRSAPSIEGWDETEWVDKAHNGIGIEGADVQLLNNSITHVRHGITASGTGVLVEGNTIDRFSEDGIRALGDDGIYRGNTIKNCYRPYYHHDDGIQSWSHGPDGRAGTGVVRNVEIIGNRIINFEDPNQPFRCQLQGIGLFDGMFENWTIANNLLVVDHFHGITVMGGIDVKLLNNTVVEARPGQPGPPWVTVVAHKDGTPGSGNVVANNLAPSFNERGFDDGRFKLDPQATEFTHNLRFDDANLVFRRPEEGDFRLRANSPAVDAGTLELGADFVLDHDLDGRERPQGSLPDVGAFELIE